MTQATTTADTKPSPAKPSTATATANATTSTANTAASRRRAKGPDDATRRPEGYRWVRVPAHFVVSLSSQPTSASLLTLCPGHLCVRHASWSCPAPGGAPGFDERALYN